MIKTNEFDDKDWGRCLLLQNDQVALTIPCEIGPRIVRFNRIGHPNLFGEFPAQKSDPDKSKWHSYGGHRLWHGPEDIVRSYYPDNDPVHIEINADAVLVRQDIEKTTQLQKEVELHLDPDGTHIRVIHRIRNHGLFETRLTLWAISVMAVRGRVVLPLPPRGSHPANLLAQTSLNLWAYTDLSLPNWQFGKKYISFKQDPVSGKPQKLGISHSPNWLAYLLNGEAFVIKNSYIDGQPYPDEGSATETYADSSILEMESLSPMTAIQPGAYAEMAEDWSIVPDVSPDADEAELDAKLAARFS